jgi:Na+-driven multidrug efflux pump
MRLIFGFCGMFIWAFAATANTMVSNVIGQGMPDKVIPLIKRIIILSAGSSLVIFIPLQLFTTDILSLFNNSDAFLQLGTPVLRIVAVAIMLMSVSTICLNAVTGTGNTRTNLMIEIITIILYCIYIYTVMHIYNLPITWGWASEWLYWSSILVMSITYLISGKWNNLRSRSV